MTSVRFQKERTYVNLSETENPAVGTTDPSDAL